MASTPLLGLALPADGVTNWGTLVNTSITALLDSAVSGTTTISSTTTPYTLTTTNEAANEARQAVILCTGSRPGIQTIVAPAQSKTYVLINATTGGFGVKIVGVGPTTGVTVPNGRAYMVAWNGSDFVITGLTTVDLATDVTGTLAIANGGTGATTAAAAITGLGATTVGGNMFTLTNPTAVTFPRFNADNTVSALNAADFRTAIGAGTGSGTVTSVTGTSPVASSGGATPAISLDAGYGDSLNPYASKTAKFFLAAPTAAAGVPVFRAIAAADIPTLNQNTTGTAAGLSATLAVASGGTGLTTYTANGVLYASGAGTLANGTGLTFDGTKLGLGVPAPFYTLDVGVSSGPFIGSFKNTSTSANQANIVLWSQGESGSAVGYVGTGGSAFSGAFSNKFVVGTQSAHALGLVASGSLRALIDSTGTFRVVGAGTAGSTDAVQFNVAAPANAMVLNSSGNLSVPGTITSTLSGTASTATNIAAGAANQIPRQSGAGATTFIAAPTTASTFLSWDGSAFAWTTATASTATNIAGGAANQIPRQSGAGATTFIAAPTTASTFLTWDGSAFTWSNVAPSGSTFATDISVNTLTVGKGPNNPVGTTTFGYQAGAAATANNVKQTAIGYRALATSTTSAGVGLDFDGCTAVGYKALESANPSFGFSQHTAVGSGALKSVTNGFSNTAVGAGAGFSLVGTSGSSATAIGANAGFAATAGSFIAVGLQSLYKATDRAGGNTAIGNNTLAEATTYSGDSAIYNQNNTAVGSEALRNLSAENSTLAGNSNTALGYIAGRSLLSGGNNLILGNNAQASTTSVSNEITLGNSTITTLRCQVTSITSLSDQRDKHSIEDLPVGLALINALRPRRYKWDKRDWYIDEVDVVQEDGTTKTDYVPVPQDGSRAQNDWNEGFVAQEAKAALEAAGASWFPLVYETNPEKLEMSSGKLIPVLVKAIQELTARLEALEAK